MTVRKILPPENEIREAILAAGHTPAVLEEKLAAKTKIKLFANNIPLALSLVAGELGVEINTSTKAVAALPEETVSEGEWLAMGDLPTTTKKLVDMRGYFLQAFAYKVLGNGNPMVLTKWADETGQMVSAVFGSKADSFINPEEIQVGGKYLLQNLNVKLFRNQQNVTIDDNVSIRELENDEYKLPPISEIVVDKIIDLKETTPDGKPAYALLKGIIVSITPVEMITCPETHKLKVATAGAWVKCDKNPCNGETVQSEVNYRHQIVIADETGEVIINAFANSDFDPERFEIGYGMFVNGHFNVQYNSVSANWFHPFNPYGDEPIVTNNIRTSDEIIAETETEDLTDKKAREITKKALKGKKDKKTPILDLSKLDFSCDKNAKEPDELQIKGSVSKFTELYYMYGERTPADLQEDLEQHFGLIKMQPVLQALADGLQIRLTTNGTKFQVA